MSKLAQSDEPKVNRCQSPNQYQVQKSKFLNFGLFEIWYLGLIRHLDFGI